MPSTLVQRYLSINPQVSLSWQLVAFWLLLYQGLNGLFIPLFYNLQVATADLNFAKSCATWSQVQALTRCTNLSLLVLENFEGLNKGKINWQVNGSSEQFP